MDTLESVIKAHIRTYGPMTIETFMGIVLGHPKLGYYITRDPLGVGGDFTTAPEISQLFGEMIGLCLADAWLRAGCPPFHLVELGPGRGTLMADLLRGTKNIAGFHEKMRLHLVETSPALRAKQEALLEGYKPTWHSDDNTLPEDAPLFIIANEFFDALPIRQIAMLNHKAVERTVGLDENGALTYGLTDAPPSLLSRRLDDGEIIEVSPLREAVMEKLSRRITTQGGIFLIIDYGEDSPKFGGDTFQAVHKHGYCNPLEHIGHADLTSHVDFYRLRSIARQYGCDTQGAVTQAAFLEGLGIRARAAMLQDDQIDSGLERLVDPRSMGVLFKVMAASFGFSPAVPDNHA